MTAQLKARKDPLELIRLMWAAKFNLPPNDARLLRVTPREAIEHLNGLAALEQLAADRAGKRMPGRSGAMDTQTRFDEEAQSFADSPHYTGDPEWDALEDQETDVTRSPLEIAR